MNHNRADFNGQSPDASDALIEQMLCDAYDAPAIPRSLRKRLDAAVAREWGAEAGLSVHDPGRIARFSRQGFRSLKAWPVAACLALALTLAFALRGDAQAYGWAAMIEALTRQPMVQIAGGEGRTPLRWLSISENSLGTESDGAARMFNFGRGVLLERRENESQVRRGRAGGAAAPDREQLVVTFLLDAAGVDSSGLRLSNLRVVDQSWERQDDEVELRIALGEDAAPQALNLLISLDPDSKLPKSARIAAGDGADREMSFTYPPTQPAEWVAKSFPASLPVVDVGLEAFAGNAAIASAEPSGVARNSQSGATTVVGGPGTLLTRQERPALAGAASLSWSPTPASKLSDAETLQSIDSLLERLWRENGVEPASAATDEELLRRVYLDLAGRTPTVTEVRNYLTDASPDRYRALVDRLLVSRDHATHLAAVWRTFLLPEGVDLAKFGGVQAFEGWLSERFAANAPYDQLVRELLMAEGRLSKSGPLVFYAALKLDADQLAARTARVFLGMRLECAQCHDDPFEPWTQRDFWSYAAFFARISRPQAKLETVSTVMRVHDVDRGEVKLPDSEMVVPPQFLDGQAIDESPEAAARRRQLALWLTGPGNPYFARAAANRVWAHLFGRGIVDPVDGFGTRHPPRSAELLDLLAGQLIRDKFDLRNLFRTIVLSKAYRLSSGAAEADEKRLEWFAQMNVKTLSAEQLYDCIAVASMLAEPAADGFALARVGNSRRDEFLQDFSTLSGRPTEYQGGIPQALTLMNGALIGDATSLASGGLLKSLEAPFFSDDERIEVLYLATLSRRPNESEWMLLRQHLAERDREASVLEPLADILWALLNGAEFTMNH